MHKPLPPELTFGALFGPRREYDYFRAAAAHPFPADAADFGPLVATRLADLALLAYVPERTFVRDVLERAGFADVRFFLKRRTFGLAATAGGTVVVAFRGTNSLERFPQNLKLLLEREGEGKVHAGYREAVDLVWPRLEAHLGERPAWFAGHSLGGGLAVVAAARYAATRGVVTFGAPRVGDRDYRDAFPAPAFRFVNNADMVPDLPPGLGYRHVGRLLYFDRDGNLREGPSRWDRAVDVLEAHVDRARRTVDRWRKGDWAALAYDGLIDHAPVLYAILAWNAFVATLPGTA
ncbi:MAG TPA: lipase family protein [Planctomycetota bacterium]|nr:lipase family protein [Planctomycetota bacterium]